MRAQKKNENEHKFQIRIDKDLFAKFQAICDEEDRSANAQIVQMIKIFVKYNEKE